MDSSHSLPPVETEQAKGRTWNGYVCPGCRNVFRVAADFAGGEVMCPSCQETLRLPKKPGDIPPSSSLLQLTTPSPAQQAEETQHDDTADEPAWRTLFATPGGRRKLSLALGIPLLLVAVVLMLLPADEPPSARNSPAPTPAQPVTPESPETPPPLPESDASQIAGLIPEQIENQPVTGAPPPALPEAPDPALVAEVSDEPAATAPVAQMPAPTDPEQGLVEALPADSPVVQAPGVQTPVAQEPVEPPVEKPATSEVKDESAATIHTVVRGDTLTKISKSYGVTVSFIRQANDLKTDTVRVGQQLRIPGAAAQPTAQPPAAETTSPPQTRHHTVVRGDTLTRIARKYAVDPKAVMRANGMKNDTVRLGAKLVIPPADP